MLSAEPVLSSVFFSLYGACLNFSVQEWRAELRLLERIGVRTIIVKNVAHRTNDSAPARHDTLRHPRRATTARIIQPLWFAASWQRGGKLAKHSMRRAALLVLAAAAGVASETVVACDVVEGNVACDTEAEGTDRGVIRSCPG
jgi:hypothetical protein